MTSPYSRPASMDFRLFSYWVGLPPGRGATMADMIDAVEAPDAQAIRASLTRLRQGRVPDPSRTGSRLRPLPVRWNQADGKYYDLSNISADSVAAQIPGSILTGAVAQLLARAGTLDSSIGSEGLVRSVIQNLLDDAVTRELINQVPLQDIWRVQDQLQLIGRAKELLELQQGGSDNPRLGRPEDSDVTSGGE